MVTGSVTLDADYEGVVSSHLDVTVQGFDVHTGATTWSDHLGNSPAAVGFGADTIVRLSADVFSLNDFVGHTTAINMRTGAMSTPSPDTVGWCLQNGFFTDHRHQSGRRDAARLRHQWPDSPCNPNGAYAAPADGTATGYGATVGGDFLWSSKDGLHAFAIGKGS